MRTQIFKYSVDIAAMDSFIINRLKTMHQANAFLSQFRKCPNVTLRGLQSI